MSPLLFIGALTAIWTQTIYQNNKPTKQVKVSLWFICWLCFLLGVSIGLLIFL